MDLREVADRLEIQQQLSNYATGVDSGDWELYKSVFTADAFIDYRASTPIMGSPEEVAAVLEPAFATIPFAQHYITNVSYGFDADGNRCRVVAYFYQPLKVSPDAKESHWYGQYVHDFVRTSDGWRSERLVEETRHTSS